MSKTSTISKALLSVALIAQDEEQNLPDCLKSVAFADQVVVVDSGSTDKSVEIAKKFGCDVFLEPWRGGFGLQKQFAIDQCRNPWILVLDADERIPPVSVEVIRQVVSSSDSMTVAYSFPRKNFFQGRWIRHAGWWPDRLVRLFRKGHGRMSSASVHEGVEVQGDIKPLEVPIMHYTESDLSKILIKIDRYSSLGADAAFRDGREATIPEAFVRAGLTFLQDYFLRGGVLDGTPGLTLAATDSINKFFKYAKLAELGRLNRKR